ncbi:hypothetical protein [Agriterribacter sp.]|uniref:hypothetical protein n=1 Tax=Agriterribacter sp. TaxID=2821509 RepID=UPI002CA2032E|nr:hypothetical protein [Agriterribacter sp.]HRP55595.1 hypothetical protein [Agriterribacter sp.]
MKIPFLVCLLTGIALTNLIAQEIPAPNENIEDSIKIYVKPFTNVVNGEVTYKSPVFSAIGTNEEKLIIQLNTTSAKDHIQITFLAKDIPCSKQGQSIIVLMEDGHSATLVNVLPSNCRNMQAALVLSSEAHLQDFSTDQSEIMFLGFLKTRSFTLNDDARTIKYSIDDQSAEKFRIAYKCFEKFTGMWN